MAEVVRGSCGKRMGVRGVSKDDVNYRGMVTVAVNEMLSVVQSGVRYIRLRKFYRTIQPHLKSRDQSAHRATPPRSAHFPDCSCLP